MLKKPKGKPRRVGRATLKKYFAKGMLPTQEHFHALIDSALVMKDEGFDKTSEEGLRISTVDGSNSLISLAREEQPVWRLGLDANDATLRLDPVSQADDPGPPPLSVSRAGRVGVNTPEAERELDVNGWFRTVGRVGVRPQVERDTPAPPVRADGKWHSITAELDGCHAFEVVAGVGGKPRDGQYALVQAIALNTFNPRGRYLNPFGFNFLRRKNRIRINQAYYRSRRDKIELRWTGGQNDYRLEMKTRVDYGVDEDGNQVRILYHITDLWPYPYMREEVGRSSPDGRGADAETIAESGGSRLPSEDGTRRVGFQALTMEEMPSIPRRGQEPDGGSFQSLRSEGLRFIAQHSGDLWTDYNLHDPGITILEQLCYGLTDLMYRVGFHVADHLTADDGRIDFEGQALHLPKDILPCRPTTGDDLQEVLLDEIGAIENAWVRGVADPFAHGHEVDASDRATRGNGDCGIYRLVLQGCATDAARRTKAHHHTQIEQDRLRAAALRVFLRNRNLCEDVDDAIVIAAEVPYQVTGEIDVSGPRSTTEILEDLYAVVAANLAGLPEPDSAARRLAEGETPDAILSGPRPASGLSLHKERQYDADYVFVAEIIAAVQAIEGVDAVRTLFLTRGGEPVHDPIKRIAVESAGGATRWCVPVLARPVQGHEVRVLRNGVEERMRVSAYSASEFRRRRRRRPYEGYDSVLPTPRSVYRGLGHYTSIQEHFPEIYGVGHNGPPVSADRETLTSIRQLKSYLLLFEQLMANYSANLEHVRDLFSCRSPTGPTYRYQVLGENEIPGFRSLYPTARGPYRSPPQPFLERLTADFDAPLERTGRLLDQMLAVFGETYPGASLAKFGRPDGRDDVDAWVVESKARYLREIVRVTRDRAGAVDYGLPLWRERPGAEDGEAAHEHSNVSGFRRRIGLLLGLENLEPRRLADGESADGAAEGFHVLEHLLLRPVQGRRDHSRVSRPADYVVRLGEAQSLWRDFYPMRMSIVLPAWVGRFHNPDFRNVAEGIIRSNCPAHVMLNCIWMGEPELSAFERLYCDWLAKRRDWINSLHGGAAGTSDPTGIDAAAHALITFMRAPSRRRDPDGP